MANTYGWSITWMCALLHWSFTNYPGSAYVQTSVGGYLFSIPGFNDQEKRTQAEAETWCTGNLSKLLQIENDSIQTSVVTFINNAINQNLMTGNNVITNGKRYGLTWTWVNGVVFDSPNLPVDEQSPGLSNSYGYLKSSQSVYGFSADTPTSTRGYICEGASLCTDGFKVNGRCYKSYSDTLSWFGARNRCLNEGGDLASFEFISNAQGFSALNGSGWNQPSAYWVGLQRLKWTWQGTSSDVKYSQWADGRPDYAKNQNNDCLCLQPYDWKWIDCDCSQTYQFVCLTETQSASNPASSTSVSTINVTSSKQVDTGTTTSQPVNSPPSITYPEYISMTTVSSKVITDYRLPVGLGVGLGGGALVVAIIVIVVVVVRRKGCHRQHGIQKPTSEPPDVTPESYYATVVKNPEFDDTAVDISQIPPPAVYADLNIVAISQSPDEKEQSRRSLV